MAEEAEDIDHKRSKEVALRKKKCLGSIVKHEAVYGWHQLKQILPYDCRHGLVDLNKQDYQFVRYVQYRGDKESAHNKVDDECSLVINPCVIRVISATTDLISQA